MPKYERRGTRKQPVYVVFHELSGRRLGTVTRLPDGTWFALRGTGPAVDMVHSPGHKTRKSAAGALR